MITILFHNVAIGIMVCYARECFQGSRSDDLKFFRFLKNSHLSVSTLCLIGYWCSCYDKISHSS